MRVLGLIPARGGSKGIPRKNIRLLCGKPLLQYTIEAAQAARHLAVLAVSTDDDEIAAVAETCGVSVIVPRPPALGRDDTPMLPVVQHAITWLEQYHAPFDAVCLLQPTAPLRTPEQIDRCIELLATTDADSVATVLHVPAHYNPHWVYFERADGSLALSTGEATPIARRQDLPPAFHREGSVYVSRRDVVMEQHSLYGQRLVGFPLRADHVVNIDTPEDWERATRLLENADYTDS